MTIPPDLEAQILRYYHVEKWRVGTIARQLHVHHGTVARVLAQAGLPQDRAAGTSLAGRALSALHPSDPGEVPDADRQPAVRDGVRTRLPRQRRSLPPPHRLSSAAPGGGGLSASAQPARRAGAGRLGAFRSPHDRPRAPSLDGLRHGAELLAPDLSALLPRCPHGELPARSRRRLRGLERMSACPALRQSQERSAGAPRRRHPLSSCPDRLRRTLSLRPASGGGGARQREGPRRARHPLRARQLLPGPKVCRSRRPQCPGRGLVPWPGGGSALPRTRHPQRPRGLCRGGAKTAGIAGQPLSAASSAWR